jgi:hypothetical protein
MDKDLLLSLHVAGCPIRDIAAEVHRHAPLSSTLAGDQWASTELRCSLGSKSLQLAHARTTSSSLDELQTLPGPLEWTEEGK